MKPSHTAVRFLWLVLLAAPLLAQTQIGGGTCSSSSLNGTYALSLTGRQVAAAGTSGPATFVSVLQANGSANFDGLSTVTMTLTQDTNQAVATPVTWSGTYSVQANCVALATITSGGSATLNVMVYSGGKFFALTGNDATYSYSGNGNNLPTTACTNGTLTGVYTFNANGFALSSSSIAGASNGAGLLQFDGQGSLTVNVTVVAPGATSTALALTGSYTIASNCVGTASLSDSNFHSYVMAFSISSVAPASTNFFASLARLTQFLMAGGAHSAYGQPAAAELFRPAFPMVLEPAPPRRPLFEGRRSA